MLPIDGIMVSGLCPPMRPKGLKCNDHTRRGLNTPETGLTGDETGLTGDETGLTAENGVHLALLPDSHSIKVYKNGKSTLSVTIDPIIRKDFRFEWTYKLSEVDVNVGYEEPLGLSNGSFDAGFDVAAL